MFDITCILFITLLQPSPLWKWKKSWKNPKRISYLGLGLNQFSDDGIVGGCYGVENPVDMVGIFTGLKKIDFPADGVISMEYEANPENPVEDVQLCLDIAKETIGKVYGA